MAMDELPDLSAGIGKLLEDPEMLGKALSIATTLKKSGMLDGLFGGGQIEASETSQEPTRKISQTYSAPPDAYTEEDLSKDRPSLPDQRQSADRGWGENNRRRKALLLALRPYMSEERQERIDTVLRILELLDLANKLGTEKN